MSDPHSPRPLVTYPDAVRTALGLMRSAVLSGESWSVELAAVYEDAVAALPAAEPAASAEADAAWEALASDLFHDTAYTTVVDRHRPLVEAAIRSAGRPPASRDLREVLREAVGTTGGDAGLPHWHQASGGTTSSPSENDRAGVFVDRQQVLDVIDKVLG